MGMNEYKIVALNQQEYKPWVLEKHYAKRLPSVSYAFGLVHIDKIVGVVTFGYPPNYSYNNGKCIFNTYECLTLELNRLVVNDHSIRNLPSYFVSNALKKLPKPCAIVSYADPNQNHVGYIYQATNWFYTGESSVKHRYHFEDGSTFDIRRGIDKKGKIVKVEKLKPTHRYIYFNASKSEKKKMIKDMKMKVLEYPKGQSLKYDSKHIDMYYNFNLFGE